MKGWHMKKKLPEDKVCEPRAEYDLEALLSDGIQGKYVERYRKGTNLVLLEPDIARAFPTQESVNEALRLVMRLSGIAKSTSSKPVTRSPRKRLAHAG
jgi:hypothetical protein